MAENSWTIHEFYILIHFNREAKGKSGEGSEGGSLAEPTERDGEAKRFLGRQSVTQSMPNRAAGAEAPPRGLSGAFHDRLRPASGLAAAEISNPPLAPVRVFREATSVRGAFRELAEKLNRFRLADVDAASLAQAPLHAEDNSPVNASRDQAERIRLREELSALAVAVRVSTLRAARRAGATFRMASAKVCVQRWVHHASICYHLGGACLPR